MNRYTLLLQRTPTATPIPRPVLDSSIQLWLRANSAALGADRRVTLVTQGEARVEFIQIEATLADDNEVKAALRALVTDYRNQFFPSARARLTYSALTEESL